MDMLSAIDARHSCRTYFKSHIKQDYIDELVELIDKFNKETGLNIQFILNDSDPFGGLKSYGIFKGVNNYIAFVGKDTDIMREKAGYYGEALVLKAVQMGLGTCWVSGTYSPKKSKIEVEKGEKLFCVVTIGNGKESTTAMSKLNKVFLPKKKSIEKLYEFSQTPPAWFLSGVEAASKAPSAMNKMPTRFIYSRGEVSAYVQDYSINAIDLGIAKLHFEIGAGQGKWQFGNYGKLENQD